MRIVLFSSLRLNLTQSLKVCSTGRILWLTFNGGFFLNSLQFKFNSAFKLGMDAWTPKEFFKISRPLSVGQEPG